jgi:hypothetical protein
MDRQSVTPENAPRFSEWLKSRGGVAIWRSVDLSDPGASVSTPALTPEGTPTPEASLEVRERP